MLKLNVQAVDVHVQDVDSLIFEEPVGDTLSRARETEDEMARVGIRGIRLLREHGESQCSLLLPLPFHILLSLPPQPLLVLGRLPQPLFLCLPLPLPRGTLGLLYLPQGLLELGCLELPTLGVSQEGRLREVLLLSAVIGVSPVGALSGDRDKTCILEDLNSAIIGVLFNLELKEAQVLLQEGRELRRCE